MKPLAETTATPPKPVQRTPSCVALRKMCTGSRVPESSNESDHEQKISCTASIAWLSEASTYALEPDGGGGTRSFPPVPDLSATNGAEEGRSCCLVQTAFASTPPPGSRQSP